MFADLTVFRKGLLLVLVPFVFQIVFLIAMAEARRRGVEAQVLSLQTKDVLERTQVLAAAAAGAQSNSRGYVISGDENFQARFKTSRGQAETALADMQQMVSDRPEQLQRARDIAAQTAMLIEIQAENIRLVQAGEREEAMARVARLVGQSQMDRVREEVRAFLDAEESLEAERRRQLERSDRWTIWVLALGGLATVGAALGMTLVFSRSISNRLVHLEDNARRLAAGQGLTPPISGRDEIGRLDRVFHEMAAGLERSTDELRPQTAILQSVLDNMGDGVSVADSGGIQRLANPAATRIIGKPIVVGTGREIWSRQFGLFLTDMVTPFPEDQMPLARAAAGENVDHCEMFVRHSARPEGVWISVTARPMVDGEGKLTGAVAVFRDITGQKKAEAEIRWLNEDLERRVRQRTALFAQANRELQETNQENAMFVYSVSHDLRSPLVNLQGFSQELGLAVADLRALVRQDEVPTPIRERALALLDGDMAESLRFIQSGVLRLSNIIDAMLRLSRAGRVEYQWQAVDVDRLVRSILDSLRATIAASGATVQCGQLHAAWGDATALEQVFANLIGNALKYLNPSRPGRIEIGCDAQPDDGESMRTFFIRDNGLGIAPAYHQKVFQAFQRVHPDVAAGEGIGLTIVRRIVERHRGKIWLQSQPGRGTTFFVGLPSMPFATSPDSADAVETSKPAAPKAMN